MENDNYFDKVGQTAADAAEYVQLQVDRMRLRLLQSFSELLNSIFAAFLLVMLGGFALLFLAAALVVALSEWVHSLVWACMIVAGVLILIAVILFLLRKKLIVNPVVRMLARAMFDIDKKREDEDDE